MKRTVVVIGSGIAAAPPDSAIVRLSVADEADDVSTALARVGELVAGLGARLREIEVADRDIKTSSLSVFPRYDRDGQQTAGFRAQHQVTVRVRELSEVGGVISVAVSAGEDRVTLDSVNLGLADTMALESRAREAGFADARRKATQLAALADAQLGSVVAVAEVLGSGAEPRAFKMAMAESAVPIEAGEESVAVSLQITFALA